MPTDLPRPRRQPTQARSRQTVDDVLAAVRLVAKRHGPQALTTNRIAATAGVSVGSVYQYFPDKRAIFAALQDRHIADVRRVLEQTTSDCASATLPEFARELVHGLVDVHDDVAEVHDILSSAVPEDAHGFAMGLHHTFERVLTRPDYSDRERYAHNATERMLFVLPRMVESLVHGAVRPARAALSRDDAKGEAIRAVEVYVSSCESRATSHGY